MSKYQDTLKKKHPARKERLLGKGCQLAGEPYGERPSLKRSKSAPPEVGVLETMERSKIVEELKLREHIQKMIEEEIQLNSSIQKLINEAVEVPPRQNTGLNVAEEVLKSVVPVLESGYKQLTTNIEQRESFKKHIMNSLKYFILPREISNKIDAPANDGKLEEQVPEQADPKNEVPLLGKPEKDPSKNDTSFTDKEDDQVSPEQFQVSGEDLTGRNAAYEVFKNIKAPIRKGYNKVQANPQDREIYTRAISSNLLAHMDRFEKELQASPETLTTPDYNAAQGQIGRTFQKI